MPNISIVLFLLSITCGGYGSQLPTMTKSEVQNIINCISDSKNFHACKRYEECNDMMPQSVIKRFEKCQKILNAPWKCKKGKPLFSNPEPPSKIFDCIEEKFPAVEGEDQKKMMDFEKCAKQLHKRTCKIPQYQ
ncbi:uncharacterized protein [Parasteatoda tepidariorum]|uniref:uncharacterized protein n=1 Tax=Parasteatoda tepidariorum TaxID=114398 RepID=UPI00077F8C09